MMSPARRKYLATRKSVQLLMDRSSDRRLRPIGAADRETLLHAALASSVGAWEAYLEGLCHDYMTEMADPLNSMYSHMSSTVWALASPLIKRFNTPNYDNSRALLVNVTGLDPINFWSWPNGPQGSAIQAKSRLDEILQVRHSFAHGFPVPNLAWTVSASGGTRLTAGATRDAFSLFGKLVTTTDREMAAHIKRLRGRQPRW